jgi:hypothetical protein
MDLLGMELARSAKAKSEGFTDQRMGRCMVLYEQLATLLSSYVSH